MADKPWNCPECGSPLIEKDLDQFLCSDGGCGKQFEIRDITDVVADD